MASNQDRVAAVPCLHLTECRKIYPPECRKIVSAGVQESTFTVKSATVLESVAPTTMQEEVCTLIEVYLVHVTPCDWDAVSLATLQVYFQETDRP